MPSIEHPEIIEVNRYGYIRSRLTIIVDQCENCKKEIKENQAVVEFKDYRFCDQECCIESFCDSPERYGVEEIKV